MRGGRLGFISLFIDVSDEEERLLVESFCAAVLSIVRGSGVRGGRGGFVSLEKCEKRGKGGKSGRGEK